MCIYIYMHIHIYVLCIYAYIYIYVDTTNKYYSIGKVSGLSLIGLDKESTAALHGALRSE